MKKDSAQTERQLKNRTAELEKGSKIKKINAKENPVLE